MRVFPVNLVSILEILIVFYCFRKGRNYYFESKLFFEIIKTNTKNANTRLYKAQ
ncbi:hypothetical protein M096_4424 [Parabacteroides distasonis str. 3999B T(B) 6]|nr:hypothetical protein M096_4424 [Parabacteroides distasonis str. 3999B T(B) 6]KDS66609.1 hypothetical protein M095_2619 [Parabacteroides distasonis str. 3999B T(B) 4]